jgi:hypothetical protein
MKEMMMTAFNFNDVNQYSHAKLDGEWWEISYFNLEDSMVWLYGKVSKRGVHVMSGFVDIDNVTDWKLKNIDNNSAY